MWNLTSYDIHQIIGRLQARRARIDAKYAEDSKALDAEFAELETLERVAASVALKYRPDDAADTSEENSAKAGEDGTPIEAEDVSEGQPLTAPADHSGGVAQSSVSHGRAHGIARPSQSRVISPKHGVGEHQQRAAMGHVGTWIASDHRVEVEVPVSVAAARTEQGQMAGRSILTSIERRDPSGQQFDLRVADRAVIDAVVTHLTAGLIQFLQQIPPMDHAVRHEAQRAMDVGAVAPAQNVQFKNPPELSKPNGYTHVVVVNHGKLAFISGQVGLNSKGEISSDFAAQAKQAFANLKTALAAAGATRQCDG